MISVSYCAVVLSLYVFAAFNSYSSADGVKWILHEPEKEYLAALEQVSGLVSTFTIAIIGAASYLFLNRHEKNLIWTSFNSVLLILIYAGAAFACYGQFYSKMQILSMVAAGSINPIGQGLERGLDYQLRGLALSAALLGLLISVIVDTSAQSYQFKEKRSQN